MKYKKNFLLVFLFIYLTSFSKCRTDSTDSILYGTKWSLIKIYDSQSAKDVSNKNVFIQFDKEKGHAGGKGGCNSFSGTLSINGNKLSITRIISTKMFCGEVQEIEDAFFSQLENVNKYEIKESRLLLYHDKELLLEFEKGSK